jgi:thiamine kinase-like enzyme
MLKEIQTYPLFQNDPILSCELLEQQGNANQTYLLQTQKRRYLLRKFQISRNREIEFSVQKKASQKGIGTKPILLDREKGLMITTYINGIHKERLTHYELKKMAQLLKKLHKIKLRLKRNSFKEHFSFKEKRIKAAFVLLSKHKSEYAIGHNDLHTKNIIFSPKGIKLIDWEYAGYSDIYFDLVSIIIEYHLKEREKHIFLRNYFGSKKINHQKIKAYTTIYRELWRLWFKKLAKGELS